MKSAEGLIPRRIAEGVICRAAKWRLPHVSWQASKDG